MRGLGNFQRDMSSFVYDEAGAQLWPDAARVQGVSSQLVQEGLHFYVTSEAELAKFGNITRVRASRIQANRLAPNSGVLTDAVLSAAAATQFRGAGPACQVVYFKS